MDKNYGILTISDGYQTGTAERDKECVNGADDSNRSTSFDTPILETTNRETFELPVLGLGGSNLQWWKQKVFTQKPTLELEAPTAVVLFSGGGGIESGMVMSGINPVVSVEFDPEDPKLSGQMADTHDRNFSNRLIRRTAQDVAKLGFPGFPKNPDFLHASPVCSNFSDAVRNIQSETQLDIDAATAVARAIQTLTPKNFTLEQVVGYKESKSYQIILNALAGYHVSEDIVNMADYGLPQNRRRLILRASLNPLPPLIPMFPASTWYQAVEDLIPDLPDVELAPFQMPYALNVEEATIIERHLQRYNGYKKICRTIGSQNQMLTLTKTKLQRGKWANILMPDGTVKDVTTKVAARLQGFPNWYQFSDNKTVAGAIIGYSVPPLFAYQMFKSFQDTPQTLKAEGKKKRSATGCIYTYRRVKGAEGNDTNLYKFKVKENGAWKSKTVYIAPCRVGKVRDAIEAGMAPYQIVTEVLHSHWKW